MQTRMDCGLRTDDAARIGEHENGDPNDVRPRKSWRGNRTQYKLAASRTSVVRAHRDPTHMPDARQYFDLSSPFAMKRGGELVGAQMAYETWGTLNAARDNAILILTGLSPSAHAAANAVDPTPGWWEDMVGPGKPIDTNRWFVICANTLGSCKGSTGAASIDPTTGELYRLNFPALTLEDAANAAHELVSGLGIARLCCLLGNSMGGMSALAYLALHPGSVRAHVSISTAPQAQPFAIAIRSLQREAIRLDPHWNQGHYDDTHYPEAGMSIARKLGVITYRSAMEWSGRFARIRLDSDERDEEPFAVEFQVESYLAGHAPGTDRPGTRPRTSRSSESRRMRAKRPDRPWPTESSRRSCARSTWDHVCRRNDPDSVRVEADRFGAGSQSRSGSTCGCSQEYTQLPGCKAR